MRPRIKLLLFWFLRCRLNALEWKGMYLFLSNYAEMTSLIVKACSQSESIPNRLVLPACLERKVLFLLMKDFFRHCHCWFVRLCHGWFLRLIKICQKFLYLRNSTMAESNKNLNVWIYRVISMSSFFALSWTFTFFLLLASGIASQTIIVNLIFLLNAYIGV